MRYIRPAFAFNNKVMGMALWCINIGIALMIAVSLLPIGLFQFHASASISLWCARSEAFLQQPFLEALR